MKATTIGKASAGVAAALSLSLGVSTAAFAAGVTDTQEDPTAAAPATALVGVGSDTIQDVMYGMATKFNTAAGSTVMQSWTATGGTSTAYRSGPVEFRPNGSGAGYTALSTSIGRTTGTATDAKPGDVDFARVSGLQGTDKNLGKGVGVVTEIPFAIDTMSIAVPAGSPFALTNGGKGLTLQDLSDIYTQTVKFVGADGKLGGTAAAAGTGAKPIWALLPKSGSGSREFFLKNVSTVKTITGITAADGKGNPDAWNVKPTNTTDPYIGNTNQAGTGIQEHNAADIVGAPAGVAAIAPFSGAKYIGYHNETIADPAKKVAGTDYVLLPFDNAGTSYLPYKTVAGKYAPDDSYINGTKSGTASFTREVYNVIATAATLSATSANAKYALLYKTFVGATSDVCKATDVIAAYGFLPDSNCGSIDYTADKYSTATVTAAASSATAGGSATVTVNVQSNGNGGGSVAVIANGTTYTGTIAAGSTSGTVSVPTPTAGTVSFNAQFTPNLAGVAPAQLSSSGSITVAAVQVQQPPAAPKLGSVAISGKAKVGKKLSAAIAPAGVAGVKYQWFANGKKIKGATKSSLKLTKKLKKKKVSVKVTAGGITKASKALKVK